MTFFALVPAALAVALFAAPATAAEETLEQIAVDGLKACISIGTGSAPAAAAAAFNLTAQGDMYVHEITPGKVDIQPPNADHRTCRVELYALTLDPKPVLDAIDALVKPKGYGVVQSRQPEAMGSLAARTTIWAASPSDGLALVTFYEVLANNYYTGPKVIIDFLIEKRHGAPPAAPAPQQPAPPQ